MYKITLILTIVISVEGSIKADVRTDLGADTSISVFIASEWDTARTAAGSYQDRTLNLRLRTTKRTKMQGTKILLQNNKSNNYI